MILEMIQKHKILYYNTLCFTNSVQRCKDNRPTKIAASKNLKNLEKLDFALCKRLRKYLLFTTYKKSSLRYQQRSCLLFYFQYQSRFWWNLKEIG